MSTKKSLKTQYYYALELNRIETSWQPVVLTSDIPNNLETQTQTDTERRLNNAFKRYYGRDGHRWLFNGHARNEHTGPVLPERHLALRELAYAAYVFEKLGYKAMVVGPVYDVGVVPQDPKNPAPVSYGVPVKFTP